ncbi:hypothetical protein IWQ62_005308 [Dispira parvispora]|uniref:RNase H type-1 domain-containing protein n=1 Tax=Dispira parvispora TaxID=1520584 RepID=A0A9W8AR86_9FUNG|nr:hypothetical protein IWQ62_005308 [Dispira parvispora]
MFFSYYAVRKGRCPGIYLHSEACRLQVKYYSGGESKRFDTLREAREYMNAGNWSSDSDYDSDEDSDYNDSDDYSDYYDSSDDSGYYSDDTTSSDSTMYIYIKGVAIEKNGEPARAGVGVFFGTSDYRNIGAKLGSYPQTHQRAELTALKWALLNTSIDVPVVVTTNNTYVIQCVTRWHFRWIENGWVNSRGYEVANADLIKEILEIMRLRQSSVKLVHVPFEDLNRPIEQARLLARVAIRV